MKSYKYVILGGGVVAGYAAKEFVEQKGEAGELCIVSADDTLPYERPPLSKSYLAGEEEARNILINDEKFYQKHGIEVLLNTVVEEVDIHDQLLLLQNGESIEYMFLLIATGSTPRHLDLPGSLLNGIYYLRTFDDAHMISARAGEAKKAVVIGGSFIGMETAASLQKRGLDVSLVFPEERVWSSFFTPEMSIFFEEYYRERGVTILPSTSVAGFEGRDNRLTGVVVNTDEILPADIVVAGVGVTPLIDIVEDSGLRINGGIITDEYLATSAENVYAAGDIACYCDVIYNKHRRIEHWDNAVAQGQCAMRTMMGHVKPFVHVPYFFSDVFDLSYEFWGDTGGADTIIHRGDTSTNSFSVWWLKDQTLLAAFVMNRPDEERKNAPEWIQNFNKLDSEILGDTSRSLEEALVEHEKAS
jgi:NADPH-dependent 2,4-dienoyl-CoA reductase/sulfur reductase-like enzyme